MLKKQSPKMNEQINTWLGKEARFEGTVRARGSLRVDGELTGDIISEGKVYLGPEARVAGNIEARQVLLAGHLKGDLVSAERVEIAPTGRLEGNVTTQSLVISEGAAITGYCASGQKNEKVTSLEVLKLREDSLA